MLRKKDNHKKYYWFIKPFVEPINVFHYNECKVCKICFQLLSFYNVCLIKIMKRYRRSFSIHPCTTSSYKPFTRQLRFYNNKFSDCVTYFASLSLLHGGSLKRQLYLKSLCFIIAQKTDTYGEHNNNCINEYRPEKNF